MRYNIEIVRPSKMSVSFTTFIWKINLVNKLDQTNSEEFELFILTIIRGGVRKILFDFDELRYIDSAGLGKIINITKNIRALKGNITITRCAPNIMDILKLVKLEKFIKIFGSNEEGINYLKLA